METLKNTVESVPEKRHYIICFLSETRILSELEAQQGFGRGAK